MSMRLAYITAMMMAGVGGRSYNERGYYFDDIEDGGLPQYLIDNDYLIEFTYHKEYYKVFKREVMVTN